MRASGVAGYAGSIAALSVGMTLALLLGAGTPSAFIGTSVAIGLLALLAASDVAVAIVNLCVNRFCNPTVLPALELLEGIPPELRTVVAVPVLLTGVPDIEEFVRGLEVHYLATQDGDIRFALLSDWIDSDAETAPADAELLARRGRRHRAPEPLARRHQRRGSLPAAAPPAPMEPASGKMDGLGAKARQAARIQPPACAEPRTRALRPSRAALPGRRAAFDT